MASVGTQGGAENREREGKTASFARGLAVIEAFGPENKTMTIAEVAQKTGLDRAVVRRLLLTLVDLGFAHVHKRKFELTTRILRLAYSFLSSAGLGASMQPFLDDMARSIGETVSLAVLDEAEIVFVVRSDVPGRRLPHVVTTGMRLPAFSSAAGRVLLAHRPCEQVEQLLSRTRVIRHTRHTIVQKPLLLEAITAAAASGHAVNEEELEVDLVSAAVPVANRSGTVVASLNVSTGASAAEKERLVAHVLPLLKKGAVDIGRMLP